MVQFLAHPVHCGKVAKNVHIIIPPNTFCVIDLVPNFSRVFTDKTFLFWQYLCHFFPNFTIFVRIITPDDYCLQVIVSANVGNQLKVKPNAAEADDALVPQCAMAHLRHFGN